MDEHRLQTSDLAEPGEPTRDTGAGDEPAPAADRPLDRDPEAHDPGRESTAGEWSSAASTEDAATDEGGEPLLPTDQTSRFTERWSSIQGGFVDRPRESVEEADALVADLMQRIAASFSAERSRLEQQWSRGDDVSTEDLRVALTRYRSFFARLLSA